ncbi:hypothetical protein BV20DRAFT_210470 [Pilatotrama ljubarskyi]|nr:hypothetical protein BV20DRAFT_210470 [Pilatotrama ljubarskyi]
MNFLGGGLGSSPAYAERSTPEADGRIGLAHPCSSSPRARSGGPTMRLRECHPHAISEPGVSGLVADHPESRRPTDIYAMVLRLAVTLSCLRMSSRRSTPPKLLLNKPEKQRNCQGYIAVRHILPRSQNGYARRNFVSGEVSTRTSSQALFACAGESCISNPWTLHKTLTTRDSCTGTG